MRVLVAILVALVAIAAYWIYSEPVAKYKSGLVAETHAQWLQNRQLGQEGEPPLALVTGATSGIGKQAARELLVQHGFSVILAGRSEAKLRSLVQELEDECRKEPVTCRGSVTAGLVDTSDLDSVAGFANWFKETFVDENKTLAVLVNNAGIHYAGQPDNVMYDMSAGVSSKQGYDLVFATNYLGHFLLTELLLPHISDRVINVASTYHHESDGAFLSGSPPSASLSTHSSIAVGLAHRLSSYGVRYNQP